VRVVCWVVRQRRSRETNKAEFEAESRRRRTLGLLAGGDGLAARASGRVEVGALAERDGAVALHMASVIELGMRECTHGPQSGAKVPCSRVQDAAVVPNDGVVDIPMVKDELPSPVWDTATHQV
jgi:hypothetical protein